ncbi:hypothetical protein VNI00_000002 [Paramarasmius palmivorus]|uniref:Uncharacterized protein n=1 Tax=Paramarasmius palmivorus TaxID=297713 RepID=A0AAW0EEK6_9AGAR
MPQPQEARRRSTRQLKVSSRVKDLDSDASVIKREEGNNQDETLDNSDKSSSVNVKCERGGSPIVWFSPSPSGNTEDKNKYGWNHPAELDYITPADWSDTKIIHHLIAHAFDLPAKNLKPGSPFIQVTGVTGTKTVLPAGYRVPLMFIARFQWLSLRLVLSAEKRDNEWRDYKYGILHVSRLCKRLLDSAQDAMSAVDLETGDKLKGMDRKWRCPTFDRAIARYKNKWFIADPSQIREFWELHKETEYEKDVLKFNWRGWALKGHRGFSLTDEEITNGITAQQLMYGLKEKDGKWHWDTEHTPIIGGTDAWSLRHAALASWPPSKSSIKCPAPPSSKAPDKPTTAEALKPTQPPVQPRVGKVPTSAAEKEKEKESSKSKAKQQAAESVRSIGSGPSPASKSAMPQSRTDPTSPSVLGKSSAVNGVSATAAPAPVATASVKPPEGSSGNSTSAKPPSTATSLPSKRPGSPLEKGGSAKRPPASSSSAAAAPTTPSSHAPPPSSNAGASTPVRVKREPSPDPDIEVLRSRPPRMKRHSIQLSRRGSPSPSASTNDSTHPNKDTTSVSKGKGKESSSHHAITSGYSGFQTAAAFSNITKDEAARLMGANETEWMPMVSSLKSQQTRDDNSAMDVDKDKTSASTSTTVELSNDHIPGLSRQGSQIYKSPAIPASTRPALAKPSPIPIPIPIPHYPASVSKPQTPLDPTITIPKLPFHSQTSRPTPSPSPALSAGAQDRAPHSADQAFMNALGLNLRMPQSTPQQHSQQNRPNPPRPNGTSNATSNQEATIAIIDSLFVGFSETLKKFSEQLRELREDGLRDVKIAMHDVVTAELRVNSTTIQKELENTLGPSFESRLEKVFRASIDGGMGSRIETSMKTGFEEMGKAMGQVMVGVARDAVGGVVRGLNQNVDQMRSELARSREREQALALMLKGIQDDMKGVRRALELTPRNSASNISPSNVAGPSTSTSGPARLPDPDLSIYASHPLAHLLGDVDTGLSNHDHSGIDLDRQYRHPSPHEAVPRAVPDRSVSGTPMSMDSDILLVEPVEQKFRPPEQEIAVPVPETPVLPPTPASPSLANQDDIMDVKPIIIDGEAYLPNANGEPIPVSSFRPSYPMPAKSNRKFRKMVAPNDGDSISTA